MAFTSVPEERFLNDVLKTWIMYFKDDTNFSTLKLMPRNPDKDEGFDVPCLVVKRVSDQDWALTRMSGYHGRIEADDPDEVGRLQGYTYMTTMQLDLYTTSINEQNSWSSLINQKIKSGLGHDVFANGGPTQTVIPLKDYATPTSAIGTATDLNIRFRFWRDINTVEIPTFDPNLYQTAFSIEFWVDYLMEYNVPMIQSIELETTVLID